MKRSSLFLSMVLCLALLALVISPVVPALAQSQLVEGLEGQNFRDLAVDDVITPGLVYRAGHLADLDEGGIDAFNSLGINRVIDLRTNTDKMRDGIDIPPDFQLPLESWWFATGLGTLNPMNPDTWSGHNVVGEGITSSVPFTQGADFDEFVWTPHFWNPDTTDPRHYNILLWSMSWDISQVVFDNWYVNIL